MVSFVSGLVALNVTRLTLEFADGSHSDLPVVGEGAGFDVNFFAALSVKIRRGTRPAVITD